jgi:putative transposase
VAKENYDQTRKWIGKSDLQKQLKRKFNLHSQTIQALTDKFVANRQVTAKLRRLGLRKIKYPYKEKKYMTIPFKQQAIRTNDNGELVLSLSKGIFFNTKYTPDRKIHTAEILFRNGRYILAITAEYPEPELKIYGTKVGVDIGEIHPVALCDENGDGLIISGRQIRAIKQWRNKSLAALMRRLSYCQKGSRQWRKYKKAVSELISKTENQLRDLYHKTTRKAINWAHAKGVAELIIGNPVGVGKNSRKRKKLNRKSAQKVSQMEYGRIKQYLKYKAKELGINTCLVSERDTSQECPVCGHKNRCTGRTYTCSNCGFTTHRDGKGAFMIIRKKYNIPLPTKFQFEYVQVESKYRKSYEGACVVGAGVAQSSLVIAGSLPGTYNAGQIQCSQESSPFRG